MSTMLEENNVWENNALGFFQNEFQQIYVGPLVCQLPFRP